MKPWLNAKTAGLPRWAWVIAFGGAVGVGLYLRHRAQAKEEESPNEPAEPPAGGLEQYEGTDTAGGLASAGLVGPAGGSVVPVNSPYIPEAFSEAFNTQGALISALVGSRTGNGEEREGADGETLEREPREGPESLTGGGAPNQKPANDIRRRERERGEKSLLRHQKGKRTQKELKREQARVKRLRKQGKRRSRGKVGAGRRAR